MIHGYRKQPKIKSKDLFEGFKSLWFEAFYFNLTESPRSAISASGKQRRGLPVTIDLK